MINIFKYKLIPILLCFSILVVVVFVACMEEEKLIQNDVNNRDVENDLSSSPIKKIVASNEIVTISNKNKIISEKRIGEMILFDMQIQPIDEAIRQGRPLKNNNANQIQILKNILQQDKTKAAYTDIVKKEIMGEQTLFYDENKTDIAGTNLYSKIIYEYNGEIIIDEVWKKESKHAISLSVNGGGNNQMEVIVSRVSLLVMERVGMNITSTLNANTTETHANLIDALSSITGTIRVNVRHQLRPHYSTDYEASAGNGLLEFSFEEGATISRIALIEGDVVENQNYTNTAEIQNIPIYFVDNTLTLNFHIEDYVDYDYNDAFITVTIQNNGIINVNGDEVRISFNETVQNIVNSTNINDVHVTSRNDITGRWQRPIINTLQRINGMLIFNFSNYDPYHTYIILINTNN